MTFKDSLKVGDEVKVGLDKKSEQTYYIAEKISPMIYKLEYIGKKGQKCNGGFVDKSVIHKI